MNNTCPSCGAVYNVAAKDIGRKIKCKKCSTPLVVSEAGLVVDAPPVAAAPFAGPVADNFSMDDDPAAAKAARRAARPARGSGGGLDAIGGVSTVLFSLGTFLVIFFAFMPIIGQAATDRANAGIDRVKLEGDAKVRKFMPKGKTNPNELTPEELAKFREDGKKVAEDYPRLLAEAQENYEQTKNSNTRSAWLEKYGLMFGFLFLSFGCIGYLRGQQPLTLRIVAGVVLGAALLLIFASSLGGCGGGGAAAKLPIR